MAPSLKKLYINSFTLKNWFKVSLNSDLKYYVVTLLFWTSLLSFPQVGVGTENPHPSAKLEIKSSIQGFLLPRHTTAQHEAIKRPATGLQVFDLDTGTTKCAITRSDKRPLESHGCDPKVLINVKISF